MELKSALNKLEEDACFKKWHSKNRGTYFSYAFKILQEMNATDWQLGFYDRKKDKITTFTLSGDNIAINPEEEVFKKEEMKINEIDIDKINLEFDSVIAKADEFQKNNYPNDTRIKTIAILQNMPKLGNVWNITYITQAFNTLNMKLDASNGKVVEHNMSSIFSFRK